MTSPDPMSVGPAEHPRPRPRARRPVRAVVVLAVLVLAAVAALVLVRHGDGRVSPPAGERPSGAQAEIGDSPAPAAYSVLQGPPVPTRGAYFGAWVDPEPYSQPGRVASVQRFERSIGRQLDIVHLYRTWTQPVGTASDLAFARRGSLLLLSWAGVDTRRIAGGAEDALIRERARQVRSLPTKVFVEWRWEMDRPNLADLVHSPADYRRAWTRIRSIFVQERVRNVGWVWCPTATGFLSGRAQAFYPGDAQVDWVCADVYPDKPWVRGSYEPFGALVQPFLKWAASRPKPVMIGEFGAPRTYGNRRAQWLAAAADVFRRNPQIKAVIYFAGDPPRKPVHQHMGLTGDPAATAALRAVARDPWFNPPREGR